MNIFIGYPKTIVMNFKNGISVIPRCAYSYLYALTRIINGILNELTLNLILIIRIGIGSFGFYICNEIHCLLRFCLELLGQFLYYRSKLNFCSVHLQFMVLQLG